MLDAWRQYWAGALALPFPEGGAPGPVQCDPDGCRIRSGGAEALLARSLRPMDCAGVALVVSAEPARGACPGLPLIDRFAAWRNGSHAVWLTGGEAVVVSDRSWRGDRPWMPRPPVAAASRATLPMAALEALPD